MLLLILVSFARAQVRLDEVEVRAPSAPLMRQTSAPLWQASESQLQEASQVQDVLTRAPGVHFTQNGGVGGRGSFYLRGGESRHALILVDGLRLNDPSGTDRGYDTAFFLSPFFQDLLYLRGPAPALYGGDATAGVVELVPRRGHTPEETVLGLSGGSFDTYQGTALRDWKAGAHQGSAGFTHLRTRGFSRLNRKRHHATEPDGAETTQVFQASRHAWSERATSDFLLYGVQGQADQDGNTADEKGDRTLNVSGTLAQTTSLRAGGGEWHARTGLNTQKRQVDTRALGHETYRGQTRTGSLWYSRDWGEGDALAGVSVEQEWLSIPTLRAQNDLVSGFGLARWRSEGWTAEVGGRGEHHQRYKGWGAGEATLKREWGSGAIAHGKIARGYKTPSLYQLYAPPSFGSPIGNPDLAPERNVSWETGVSLERAWQGSLVYFQQDFQDLIAFDGANGYANRGTLRVRGLEAAGLTPEGALGQLGVSWTLLDFSHYTKTPLRRPPYLSTFSWTRGWGARWETGAQLRLVGGRTDVNSSGGQAPLAAYELLGLTVKYFPDVYQEWLLQIGNVTDRRYEDLWGYSTAPVSVMLKWLARY